MTINEQIKDILEDFEHDRASEGVFVGPVAYGRAVGRILSLIQPKTTNTDIELKREYAQMFGIKLGINDFLSFEAQPKEVGAYIDAWNYLAPNLSNKSELKKEEQIIRDFIEWKHNKRIEFHGKKTIATEGVYKEDLKLIDEYLSSNEKNSTKLGGK